MPKKTIVYEGASFHYDTHNTSFIVQPSGVDDHYLVLISFGGPFIEVGRFPTRLEAEAFVTLKD